MECDGFAFCLSLAQEGGDLGQGTTGRAVAFFDLEKQRTIDGARIKVDAAEPYSREQETLN